MDPTIGPQKRLVVAAAVVWISPAELLVQRRPPHASHGAGMLELPGGKVERGEGPRDALARELVEEWGPAASELAVGPVLDVLHHCYPSPEPEVLLVVYGVDGQAWRHDWRARIRLPPGSEVVSHPLDHLPLEEFLPADRPFLRRLQAEKAAQMGRPG